MIIVGKRDFMNPDFMGKKSRDSCVRQGYSEKQE